MLRPSLLALIAPPAQPLPADYTVCVMVNPAGPIGKPHRRMNGTAPVSSLT